MVGPIRTSSAGLDNIPIKTTERVNDLQATKSKPLILRSQSRDDAC